MSNILYNVNDNKYLVADIECKKIKKKRFYYNDLSNLDFVDPVYWFFDERHFWYFTKNINISFEKKTKITKNILDKYYNNIVRNIKLGDSNVISYYIEDIFIDEKPEEYVLWIFWNKFIFNINVYYLNHNNFLDIRKLFWTIKNISVLPSSFFFIKWLKKNLNWQDYFILFVNNDNIKIVLINSSFYKFTDYLNIWITTLQNMIIDTFGNMDFLKNYDSMSDFHKKLYKKNLILFLEMITWFIKSALDQANYEKSTILTIWNISKFPEIIDMLWNQLKKQSQKNITILPFHSKQIRWKNEISINLNTFEKSL